MEKNKKLKNFKIISLKILFLIFLSIHFIKKNYFKKKVGIIGLSHSQNIGNNLLKYAIYIKLSQLGYNPFIIGTRYINDNISFINESTQMRLINESFDEIKENDYDILIVNSDQTWRKWLIGDKDPFFYDIAFLKFSEKWEKPKFVYGASIGIDKWELNEKEGEIAKYLLKNFTGISVREKGTIKYIENYLGLKAEFVLDPTLLINKSYYLDLIKNFKNDIIIDDSFILVYKLSESISITNYINMIKNKYNYKIYYIDFNITNTIQKFIYGIYNCKGIITDSYHGTLFSIIFNKPFISFIFEYNGKERFNSLKEIFNISDRIFELNSTPNVQLIETPLNLNKTLLKYLKKKSIAFLKKNLNFSIF